MGKTKISRLVTDTDINRLENVVVAYNTVFLMSSIFLVLIASTTRELFSDVHRILSPSLVLLIVACFVIFLAVLGYVGVGKKSSSLISLYSILLIFIFILEISAGLGILSFRKDIQTMVASKMKKTLMEYPMDPKTANLVDYVQLELECCGVNSFREWDGLLEKGFPSSCKIGDISLPNSCCVRSFNSSLPVVNRKGCLPAINFMLHRSTLSLTVAILAICTIQILGAYVSYTLASSLHKYKIQKAANAANEQSLPPPYEAVLPVNFNEKSGYF